MSTRAVAIAAFLLPIAATAGDTTETVLTILDHRGAEKVSTYDAQGVSFNQKITKAGKAQVPDAESAGFEKSVQATFSGAMESIFVRQLPHALDAQKALRENGVWIVIDDTKESPVSLSKTYVHSRVIAPEVKRWLKIERGQSAKFLKDLTSIHELTHVMQYLTDPEEAQMDREFSAILVESLRLVETLGEDRYLLVYLPKVAGGAPTRKELESDTYTTHSVIRYLTWFLFKNVHGGKYTATSSAGLLQKFSESYFLSHKKGRARFDAVAAELGVLDTHGKPLTLAILASDLIEQLKL
ncbi:MAG: hypothetical protein ACXWP5_12915 [Bdellovibrionota bacterium]